jgi:hypothetical protein
VPPHDLPFMQNWSVLAGGKTKRDLRTISAELGISVVPKSVRLPKG